MASSPISRQISPRHFRLSALDIGGWRDQMTGMNDTNARPDEPHRAQAQDIDAALLYGVRTRRIVAFFVDYAIVIALVMVSIPLVAIAGVATLGVAWLFYFILGPAVALIYIGWTMGGPKQATLGMQLASIRIARYDGQRLDTVTAIVHAVLFWSANAILTPFIVAVSLFTRDKRMLHDIFLGTVAIRSDVNNP